MRKIILIYPLLLTFNFASGQLYRNLFDKLNQSYFTGINPSFYTNIYNHILHNEASTLMRSYIVIYKTTGDKKYLNNFIIYAKRVQELRDDNIINVENAGALQGLGYTDDVFYHEGGDYSNYVLWKNYWDKKIGASGNFNDYYDDLKKCHFENSSRSSSTYSVNWDEVGLLRGLFCGGTNREGNNKKKIC